MIQEKYHYDEAGDRLIIERVQDVQPILEANKRAFEVDDRRFKRPMTKVATIPTIIIDQYLKKGIDLRSDRKELRKFLNDPDNKLFRTKPGKI